MTRHLSPMRSRSFFLLLPLLLAALALSVPALGQRPKAGRKQRAVATPRSIPTNELLIFLQPGADPAAFARDYGMTVRYRLRSDPDAYVFAAGSVQEARHKTATLRLDRRPRAVYDNRIVLRKRHAFTPDDPYFPKDAPAGGWPGQWHLVNQHGAGIDAGVEGAWNRDLTGTGVTIGIVDDGLETGHEDLAANYVPAKSYDFGQNDADPSPVYESDAHGTSVAGVAAARGGNAIGVTGAAPLASLAGLRCDFDSGTTAQFVDATLYHSSGATVDIDIKNHSYGFGDNFVPADAEVAALAVSTASGTIHVYSAGNERCTPGEDAGKKQEQASPDVITVTALGSNGVFAPYSNFGANVFVTAPASDGLLGITTTDRSGDDGYNADGTVDPLTDAFPDTNYTSYFGGTSSAAPLVAGVIAMGKQANPALDVRLAKHALVRSSRIVDFSDASEASDGGWRVNAAGYHFNPNYGFGGVNADDFTRWVVALGGVGAQTAETVSATAVNATIPDNAPEGISRTFTLSSTTPLEEVMVWLDVTHEFRGDVEAYLTSPSGTRSRLTTRSYLDPDSDITWTFTTNAFWGENPQGTWTLTVADVIVDFEGTWNEYAVQARMGAPTGSPVALSGLAVTTPTPVQAGAPRRA